MIERSFDPDTGIIYVTGTGRWTRLSAEAHYAALRGMIETLRVAGYPIRVLSDVSAAPRQDPALEAHIVTLMTGTFRRGDRFAVLTANMTEKAHVLKLIGGADFAVFASRIPAEQWLLLDELPRTG